MERPADDLPDFLRAVDTDQIFAKCPVGEDCKEAYVRASAKFDVRYPGRQLHGRLYRNERMFDRQLAAWVVGLARAVSRVKQKGHGRQVTKPSVRRNDWITAAGLDALTFLIRGYRFPATAEQRAEQFGIRDVTFSRLRNLITCYILEGWWNYSDAADAALERVVRKRAWKKYLRDN